MPFFFQFIPIEHLGINIQDGQDLRALIPYCQHIQIFFVDRRTVSKARYEMRNFDGSSLIAYNYNHLMQGKQKIELLRLAIDLTIFLLWRKKTI